MWEVDPETKSKLLALQKAPGNTTCCDCSAPSPQWASPKFGTFICLTCAGLHRGLGVHISFVRSITMDAFKGNEILRMEKGGNEKWRAFWEKSTGGTWGRGVEGGQMAGFEERYAGSVGEEWKERLSCEVEGREFGGMPEKVVREKKKGGVDGSSMGMGARSQKEMNEDFFARKGNENESRRADLPPSQGGKYAGFGSGGSTTTMTGGGGGGGGGMGGKGEGMPGVDEFQKDPVAALTKGFGWFTTTVGKSAKSVNDGWIQPNVQKLAEADLTNTARLTAAQVASNIQAGSKNAAEQFNKFVEDSGTTLPSASARSTMTTTAAAEPEHKDFWDSFGSPVASEESSGAAKGGMMGEKGGISSRDSPMTRERTSPAPAGKPSAAVGTAAMRKGAKEKEEDKWEDF
ncbi:ADP-ribosylation factor GTPase-activating protein gcs1 [Xanthoria parietina]